MKIVVCIKQVPDTSDIKWTENNTLQREGVESIINPYDLYAIEEALKIKRNFVETEIIALTMGPLQACEILKKAISLGCDKGILLSDKKFAGADTYATAKTLAAAIKSKIPDFDLILCGQFAIDGDTAQTGPSIATQLDIPQVTFAKSINRYENGSLYVIREIDEGYETVHAEFPALICVLKGEYETSRPTISGIMRANKTEIETFSLEDIELCPEDAGIKGSPTFVSKAFRPEHNREKCHFVYSGEAFCNKLKEYANE